MTFLEELQSHKGGLLHIKSQLFWYGGRGWDRSPGWVCLVLDAEAAAHRPRAELATARTAGARVDLGHEVGAVLLLIDGCPQWIWVAKADVELL